MLPDRVFIEPAGTIFPWPAGLGPFLDEVAASTAMDRAGLTDQTHRLARRPATPIVTTDEGHTFEPFTDGWAVGFLVTHADGRQTYLYFNPSGGDDGDDTADGIGLANAFVYVGPNGNPEHDATACYIAPFSDRYRLVNGG